MDFLSFDWGALSEPAKAFAIEAAKKGVTKGGEQVAKKVGQVWSKVDWSRCASDYCENLSQFARVTKVIGNPKAIEIDKIYTDVYVFDKLTALRRFSGSLNEEENPSVHEQLHACDRLPALEVVDAGDDLFILGKPGAGKTTFLKHLTMLACSGAIRKTPVFVSLKDWSDSGKSLLDFVSRQFDICGFPSAESFILALLKSGKALILLDGLDEVNEVGGKRRETIREIVQFSKKYKDCQFCVTCRVAASDYSFERFKYVEVADFTLEQQESFAKHWYGSDAARLGKFLEAWHDSQNAGLRELGRTPLLLTLLCLAFDET